MIDDRAEYCRRIESYLCGKNDGHLVRIVGPAFEMVCGWAQQGVPLKVAYRGIDRYCERYYAKGARRRPVHIEFCEADVLDAFDDWRRAVGVTPAEVGSEGGPAPRRVGLASHIERVIARLTALRSGDTTSREFDERIASAIRELDALAGGAKHARGEARASIVERLATLDRTFMQAVTDHLDPRARADLRAEAERELAAFGARLAADARARAVDAAFERLVRDSARLPVIRFE